MGSGKDTVGNHLVEQHGFTSIAFADPLKDCLSAMFSWDRDMLAGRTTESRQWREQIDPWWADKLGIPHFTPRFAMQHIGTDVMRKVFHDDMWLLNMEKRINESDGPLVVTDGRFANEIKMLRRVGGRVFRVKRGPDPIWMNVARKANEGDVLSRDRLNEVFRVHQSEWAWVGEDLDGSIRNDGTLDDLIERAHEQFGFEKVAE
jgi:hypothetical protein